VPCRGRFHRRRDRVGLRDIGRDRQRAGQGGRLFFQLARRAAGQRDPGAERVQAPGDGGADAGPAPVTNAC